MIEIPTAIWAHPIFDVLAWMSGAAAGYRVFRWRLRGAAERLAVATGPGYFAALAAGAIPGAWLAGSFNTLAMPIATLSHSVVGALAGAIVGVEIYKRARGLRGSTGGLFVTSFTLGIVIGRWGCLFTGLPDMTYGVPTRLPWGVDLGDGIARHPVQIYESAAMAVFLAVYLRGLARRDDWAMRRGFYAMAFWYGMQRFVWEFLKPYPPVLGNYNVFHLISLGVAVYGAVCFIVAGPRPRTPHGGALSVPRTNDEPVRGVSRARADQDHCGGRARLLPQALPRSWGAEDAGLR